LTGRRRRRETGRRDIAALGSSTYVPAAIDLIAWTIHTYDAFGNVATTRRVRDFATQAGPLWTNTYSALAANLGLNLERITRQGDKDGNLATVETDTSPTLVYDPLGRPTTDLRADWHTVTKAYDATDRITRITDAVGQLRDLKYDANGNAIDESLTLNLGGTNTLLDRSSVRYDLSDRKVATVDAGGFVTAWQYDAAGNVVKITNPDNYSVSLDYDPANRVSKAYDQEGNAVTTTRDLDGKVRSVTDPNGNATVYEYWDATKDGRLKKTTAPKIQSFAAGAALQYDYDANGNVVSVTEVPADGTAGRVTLTQYDELNRPTRVNRGRTTISSQGRRLPAADFGGS
jgi:YD repeat-containing protein